MTVEADARKLQMGALIGYLLGWQVGERLFVPKGTDTTAVFPAILSAGVGVAAGSFIALRYLGGEADE
jgi:hypothetical protein